MATMYQLGGLLISLFVLVSLITKWRRRSIDHLPGPPSPSWLAGNLSDIQRPDDSVGDTEFPWLDKYGAAFKIRGPFGKDLLYLADPKGLQYVLNTAGYNFPKTKERRAFFLLATGPGVVAVQGEHHARHRKVMNPAFSYSALKSFVPCFFQTAGKVSEKWKQVAQDAGSASVVLNMSDWMARATLDVLGELAFNHEFGALDNLAGELTQAFENLLADAFSRLSDVAIAAQALLNHLPLFTYRLVRHVPNNAMKRLVYYQSVARRIAWRLITREQDAIHEGKPVAKDMMSLLVRANDSEDPNKKLSYDEIIAQMNTLLLAGHETTATSITWMLYEISKRPDIQRKIRDEIKAARAAAALRGDENFGIVDMEAMRLTLAAVKESLRIHPVGPWSQREASREDIIPLSIPQRTVSGEYVTSIPVSKGQEIFVSLCGYNRLKSVWGTDADQWRPERFLDESITDEKAGLGAVANLATFSAGPQNCIGWRFAMLEMQAMLIEFIENFEFSLAPNGEIIRVFAGAMTPMIKGQIERGTQMPLVVTPLA